MGVSLPSNTRSPGSRSSTNTRPLGSGGTITRTTGSSSSRSWPISPVGFVITSFSVFASWDRTRCFAVALPSSRDHTGCCVAGLVARLTLDERTDRFMHGGDRAGALAGGCGDPLHRAGVDVADREHARDAGLERKRPPPEAGPGRAEV